MSSSLFVSQSTGIMTDIASSILAAFPSLSPSNTLNLYTLFYPFIFTKENHMLTRELLASYIDAGAGRIKAVSYTHLTLPTISFV